MRITLLRCPNCGTPVAEVQWVGKERTRCRNRRCSVRLFIDSDGKTVNVLLIDKAPALVPQSA